MATTQTDNTNTKFTADMVRTYLREIGRTAVTREQEIVYKAGATTDVAAGS